MKERRRSHRQSARFPVRYRPVGTVLVDEVENLSDTGMLLRCIEPLPLGTLIALSLPEGRSETLDLEAEVVRVIWGGREGGKSRVAGMAVRFTGLSETARERLLRIIEKFSDPDGDT